MKTFEIKPNPCDILFKTVQLEELSQINPGPRYLSPVLDP